MCPLVVVAVIGAVSLFLLTTTGMIWTGFGLALTFAASLTEERRRPRGWLSAIWYAGLGSFGRLVVEARASITQVWPLPAWLLAFVVALGAILAHGLLWPVELLTSRPPSRRRRSKLR